MVHTTELYSNIFGLPGAALAGVPVRVGNRREINPDKTRGQIALQRAAYRLRDKVVANSRAAADRLRPNACRPGKIGVSSERHRQLRVCREPIGQPLRRVVVVANLRKEKGHDVLIDAAPEILRHFPDAHFDIIGGGPELGALTARAKAQGVVQHAFTFVGHRAEDVPSRLHDGGHLRAAVAVGGVSERGARSDERRPADRRLWRRRHSRTCGRWPHRSAGDAW